MKKLGVLAVVLALSGMAQAAIYTTAEQGALQMQLTVQPDGTATLGSLVGALNVDAWEIWSAGGDLDPAGWVSVEDHIAAFDYATVGAILGPGGFAFAELTGTAGLIAEGTLGATPAQFDTPGVTSGAWPMGHLVNMPAAGAITLYYSKPTTPGDKYLGVVEVIPEPATMSLLALGGLGLLARRRR